MHVEEATSLKLTIQIEDKEGRVIALEEGLVKEQRPIEKPIQVTPIINPVS